MSLLLVHLKKRERRTRVRQLLVILGLLVLAACGPAQDPASVEPVGGASGTERAVPQILRVGNGAEPQTLDPHRAEGVPESNILRDLFEGLTSETPDGEVIPGAAESWTISEDGLVYPFLIRENARWSNGDPLTARGLRVRFPAQCGSGNAVEIFQHSLSDRECRSRGERRAAAGGSRCDAQWTSARWKSGW